MPSEEHCDEAPEGTHMSAPRAKRGGRKKAAAETKSPRASKPRARAKAKTKKPAAKRKTKKAKRPAKTSEPETAPPDAAQPPAAAPNPEDVDERHCLPPTPNLGTRATKRIIKELAPELARQLPKDLGPATAERRKATENPQPAAERARYGHLLYQVSPPTDPDAERTEFRTLQRALLDRWWSLRDIETGPRDVVVVPSLSLDGFQLSEIEGINHYEERMLFTLGMLRRPRARLVYVTSQPLHPTVVDYYLALIGGIPTAHARERLTLLSTYDSTPIPLTQKILNRPRLMERIRHAIHPERTHLTVFAVSDAERRLANALGIPLYGVDPDLLPIGTKSGSREVFREAGIPMAPGVENLYSQQEVAESLASLWEAHPELRRVLVKLNEGFSGEGNAVLRLAGELRRVAPKKGSHKARVSALSEALETQLHFAGVNESWPRFRKTIERIGGVVEAYVEGPKKRSPSAQLRINPRGELEAMSTHDQMLGGQDGQTYLGCSFPADEKYRLDIQNDALRVGEILLSRGVVGRVAVDFVTVERKKGVWERHAIEINMRMTGTTHPIMTLKLTNNGEYDPSRGLYLTPRGEPRYYVSSDNLMSSSYAGLLPEDVLDIAAVHDLHYLPWKETGVIFHLLGAVSQYGKCGLTAIGATPTEARRWFDKTRAALDEETGMGSHSKRVP